MKKNPPVKFALGLLFLGSFFALFAGGCAYHLGPTNGAVAGARTVEIHPFKNQTLEARINDDVTAQVRKEIQRDGTYRLATRVDTGDIIVEGYVTDYKRMGMTYQPNDVVTVHDFRIVMTVHVIAHEQSSGAILFDQTVTGSTLVRAGADLPSDERQAMPVLAADVAKKVTSLIVDGSW